MGGWLFCFWVCELDVESEEWVGGGVKKMEIIGVEWGREILSVKVKGIIGCNIWFF